MEEKVEEEEEVVKEEINVVVVVVVKKLVGGGCNNCNQGKFFLREYNNLANGDVRNFYENTNSNHHVPTPYQKGGGRELFHSN